MLLKTKFTNTNLRKYNFLDRIIINYLYILYIYPTIMPLSSDQIPREEAKLFCPPLSDVSQALKEGLSMNYESVDVTVVDCPDLRGKPFSLAAQGLGGNPTVVEVGGVPNLMPLVDRTKVYDFRDLNHLSGVNPAFIVGAGAGPFPHIGVNCELIANCVVEDGNMSISKTHVAKLKDENINNDVEELTLPGSEPTYGLMGNLFLSEGKPGKVLKISCKKRTGKDDFPTACRESLLKAFPGKAIGVGGVFLASGSRIKQHVMPDFSKVPLNTPTEIDKWLRFYNMTPPLVAVGTFVTEDMGLNLRMIHFHSFSDRGEAGHYHYDTEPEKAEYLAYFNLGSRIVRLDKPSSNSKIGHN